LLQLSEEYWFGYFDVLRRRGYNGVCLYVSGLIPLPGYDPTLQWRCEYVPEMVDYLHAICIPGFSAGWV